MIEVENLTKRYGEHYAIRDISFAVDTGEIMGFLGLNGAGKTTTMRILSCFMPATAGTARVCGFNTFDSPLEIKRRTGYMPERPPIYRDMLVDHYLRFVGELKGIPHRQLRAAIERVVELTNIGEIRGRLIKNISKGFQQRVGLAQALIHNPEVLILDEPTVGLDPKQIIEIRELIKSLAGEHTILVSTHILPEVTMTCQKVAIINDGVIVAVDTLENLSSSVERGQHVRFRVARPSADIPATVAKLPGVARVTAEDGGRFAVEAEPGAQVQEHVADTIVNKGWGLMELVPATLSLEDIFLKLITTEEGVAHQDSEADA